MKPAKPVNWGDVLDMLDIMAHAYECAEVDEALPLAGYRVEYKESGVHQGIVLDGEDGAIVAVCGSNQIRDWTRVNFRARPVRRRGRPGRWHKGFALAGDVVSEWFPEHRRYYLVGHSMGAAAILNAAADLHPFYLRGILLLDPPRTCHGRLAAHWLGARLRCPVMRLTTGASIVARSPPEALGYYHPPDSLVNTVEITLDGEVLDRERTPAEWFSDVRAAWDLDGCQLIRDHVIPGLRKHVAAIGSAEIEETDQT